MATGRGRGGLYRASRPSTAPRRRALRTAPSVCDLLPKYLFLLCCVTIAVWHTSVGRHLAGPQDIHRDGEALARTHGGAPHVSRPGRRHMGGRPKLATASRQGLAAMGSSPGSHTSAGKATPILVPMYRYIWVWPRPDGDGGASRDPRRFRPSTKVRDVPEGALDQHGHGTLQDQVEPRKAVRGPSSSALLAAHQPNGLLGRRAAVPKLFNRRHSRWHR